jgi:hypothetical protein
VAASIVCDHAESLAKKERHLAVPVIRGQGPSVCPASRATADSLDNAHLQVSPSRRVRAISRANLFGQIDEGAQARGHVAAS